MNRRNSLALLLALILLIGFTATSVFSYLSSSRLIRANLSDRELPLTGDNVYSEIQKDILRPVFIASQMAQNTFMRDWLLAGQRDVPQLMRYLEEIKTSHNTITAFLVTDNNKTYYHYKVPPRVVSPNVPSDGWYFKSRAIKEPYEVNVDQDKANRNALTIFINHRILGYNGEFLGITGVGLSFSNISALLADYERKYQSNIFFLDADGTVVVSAKSSNTALRNIKETDGLRDIAAVILSNKTEPLRLQYVSQDGGRGERQVQLNARYVPELKWHLLVEQDSNDAVKPVLHVLFINLGFSALAALVVFYLTLKAVRRQQLQLEGMASTDSLTGLLNRQAAQIRIKHHMRQLANASGGGAAGLFFDVDFFKKINDTAGHQIGDAALIAVAQTLKKHLPEGAILARWGGEEFFIFLPEASLEYAESLADTIRLAVLQIKVAGLASSLQVSISCGVGVLMRTETFENFFARVDAALYRAKANGRNCVEKSVVSNWGV